MTTAPFYRPARFLERPGMTEDLPTRIVRYAVCSVHTMEEPLASNRGPEIDAWNRWAGVPESLITAGQGFWCCSWATRMWHDAGAVVKRTGSCDALLAWGRETERFTEHAPSVGAFVLYGKWNPKIVGRRELLSKTDAVHVGIVARIKPQIGTVEGNTTVEGSRLERNGTAIATKLLTPDDPVIGFVHVYPL